jgi:hypothetical protein
MNARSVPAHFRHAASGWMRWQFTGRIESDYFREVKENDQIAKRLEIESTIAPRRSHRGLSGRKTGKRHAPPLGLGKARSWRPGKVALAKRRPYA